MKYFHTPKNTTNVKQFLGLVGYYRRFISHFAEPTKPLTKLLKKGTTFKWEKEEQDRYENMKTILCNEPILQVPRFEFPFIITTDASDFAIGAVLSQGPLGQDLPIAYASRTLNSAKRNYSTTEKECLAIIFAILHFRPYIFGRKFTIVTDHQTLTWLHSVKDPTSRLIRWRLKLSEFENDVKYKPGKTNKNADALFRNPVQEPNPNHCQLLPLQKTKPNVPKRKRGGPKKESTVSETSENEKSNTERIGNRVKQRNFLKRAKGFYRHFLGSDSIDLDGEPSQNTQASSHIIPVWQK